MNTLHLCHWQDRRHFKSHLDLIGKQDSIVIYGNIESSDKHWLTQNLHDSEHTWHLVNNQPNPNISRHEINNDQWLTLIIEHKNTLAWK
ncbi:hypothetical protein MNBD_GAMMA02-328 [hydrothermal vent metagenome]|uniref:Uncharacterized protein n=1 Tax=hydrothermal vent metagenome TaxID=652676 RepID=A0A3B0VLS1_9ZZZZ